MAKRVMLSDEAYSAKKEGESFSDVILRRFGRGNPATILAYFKEREPNPDRADTVEKASRELGKNLKLRHVDFS